MTEVEPDQPPLRTPEDVALSRVHRKRAKIQAELARNRAGDHRVPTWALVAALVLVLLVWFLLVVATA